MQFRNVDNFLREEILTSKFPRLFVVWWTEDCKQFNKGLGRKVGKQREGSLLEKDVENEEERRKACMAKDYFGYSCRGFISHAAAG